MTAILNRFRPSATAARSVVLATALVAGLAQAPGSVADMARVLDDSGHVLSVGNWVNGFESEGFPVRIETPTLLTWELTVGGQVLISGVVPGTLDELVDSSPALSRNPATGHVLLLWVRESPGGSRDIVAMPFVDNAWLPAASLTVDRGSVEQVDVTVLHSATGRAYLAWRDVEWSTHLAVFDPGGSELYRQELTAELSTDNGPPKLGVDTDGNVIVAFFGTSVVSGESEIFVMAAGDGGTGNVHVPDPVAAVGVESSFSVPRPTGVPAQPGEFGYPDVHLTSLGDTSVVWWVDSAAGDSFRYVHRSPGTEWQDSPVGRVDLSSGTDLDVLTAGDRA